VQANEQPGESPATGRAYILAIDQGTTNTKAILVDPSTSEVATSGSRPVGISFPAPGWVEQDAEDLWQSTLGAVGDCLSGGVVPAGIAISNQRESVVAWSRSTGAPLGPVLGWQDGRTTDLCASLTARRPGTADLVRARTGLALDPMFSAPKMRWLLDAALAAGAERDDVRLGTVDAWLIHRLTGENATEVGNASRTLLLALASRGWDPELLDLFGIPAGALPEIRDSDAGFGRTAGVPGIPDGVPVVAVLADSHAALYYHRCTHPGTGKATYGTGSSVMTPCAAPTPAPTGIATTVAWVAGGEPTYAREGNIIASGSALDWMARILGVPAGTSGGAYLAALAAEVPDAGGVTLVPAFSGLGAPYWDRSASGVLTGITAGTTQAHLARAALEAVAHQVADVVEAIESDGGASIDRLHADGGATASSLLMQLQADLLGRGVHVADVPEASALGAAALGARALGLSVAEPATGVVVDPVAAGRADRRRAWSRAVARSRGRDVISPQPVSPVTDLEGEA
jgi:glycerol kinase